jgi:hypothetical protein
MILFRARITCAFGMLALATGSFGASQVQKWSLSRAVEILNSSPWARHETFTRVIGGVGSGISGEKEIFDTFYVRFFSAPPVREALARILQIQYGYDQLGADERQRFDQLIRPGLELDVGSWIVVTIGFRSNDPNEESSARRFFQKETAETLRNKAFLSTDRFSQVPVSAYFPPREETIGAKFIFPRSIDGVPVVSKTDRKISFELLEVPGASPRLRSTFGIKEMLVNGELIL